jgi:hypothetical protein
MTPVAFGAMMAVDTARRVTVIRQSGVKPKWEVVRRYGKR